MKKVIGMIHLAGPERIKKAIEEINIFEQEGLYGCIIENYHAGTEKVLSLLEVLKEYKFNINIGVNILPNEYQQSFEVAAKYRARFIQMDIIAGDYERVRTIKPDEYHNIREMYPLVEVMGGVWPKYYQPVDESLDSLKHHLDTAMLRCDMIVVTGKGTGMVTPTEKVQLFRDHIGNFPLIVGAGVNESNVEEQMSIADGCIVGSAFKKDSLTTNPVDKALVRAFMNKIPK